MKAFASGYMFKSQCRMLAGVAYRTATSRTPQEMFIKEMLLSGLSPAERCVLADVIGGAERTLTSASAKTIANKKKSIFKKNGRKNYERADSRVQVNGCAKNTLRWEG